ncbi:LysR family transcriptional regulator [Paenibacillus oralis]|uniref:LysR family transcriptional regulator n=1 Tax=Paenibacillus oralis TaxID=2490856 RepID=A0A3P3U9H8_9BACL|nr:LysR family transcriptional regulator [Paenibacillus oralis]RRJ65113.1 LysR family transcriptional regulator [Paenibacillus oralis]
MNLETLKLFLDIAKLNSISKAAQKAHITQSALSQQLKSWETSLGTELLQRSNKGARLTETGEIAQKYAAQICKLYEDMLTEIEQINPAQVQHLSIYAIPEVCSYALPCTLFEVKKHFPYCNISLNEALSPDIEEHILLEEGDIGFISGPSSKSEIISYKVFSDQVMLVSSSSKPAPHEIQLEELSRYSLIGSPQLICVQRSLANTLTENVKLNIVYSLDSIEAVKLAAIKGHGAAFLPYMSIKKELYHKQLKPIHIRNLHVCNDVYIVKKHHQKCKRDTKQLVQYIEQTLIDTLC